MLQYFQGNCTLYESGEHNNIGVTCLQRRLFRRVLHNPWNHGLILLWCGHTPPVRTRVWQRSSLLWRAGSTWVASELLRGPSFRFWSVMDVQEVVVVFLLQWMKATLHSWDAWGATIATPLFGVLLVVQTLTIAFHVR